MAEEDKNKVTSVSPPPTDEIDDEWGSSSGASKPKQDKPVAKAATKAKPASSHDDDEDDEDEDDDDRDDDEDDRDDEDDDDADEDDDDDDEEPRASARQRSSSPNGSADWLPEWSPWAVLGLLLAIGLLGGIGVIPVNFNLKQNATAETPTAAVAAAAPTTTAPKPAASVQRAPMGGQSSDQERIAASHLLVQYKGSMRAAPIVTRTKEEAKKRAEEALAKAKKGVPFDKLVAEYSDEPGAAARGGKLGKFPRQAMVPAFANAAFALKPGEISPNVVETQFGYHVIQRTE